MLARIKTLSGTYPWQGPSLHRLPQFTGPPPPISTTPTRSRSPSASRATPRPGSHWSKPPTAASTSMCYRFVGSQPEAEDLTQDVFIKVFCNLRSYDPERGSFRNWLKNVTRNHLVDRFRRTKLARLSSSSR